MIRWKSLAGEMDALKGAILLTGGLSALAGLLLLYQWNRHRTYSAALGPAQKALDSLYASANQIKVLEDEVKNDVVAQTQDPTFYILQQASGANVGEPSTSMDTKTPFRGVEDRVFTIRPPDKTKVFTRLQLATFFWRIETYTSRMRVTQIQMDLADRKRPEDDIWTFLAQFTSRARLAQGPPAAKSGG